MDYPFEILIPRDPASTVPSMYLQNVTSIGGTAPHSHLFYLHYVNITDERSVSVHFELHPLNISLSYLFIYKFDRSPVLNSSVQQIDGWTIFCPSSKITVP